MFSQLQLLSRRVTLQQTRHLSSNYGKANRQKMKERECLSEHVNSQNKEKMKETLYLLEQVKNENKQNKERIKETGYVLIDRKLLREREDLKDKQIAVVVPIIFVIIFITVVKII